MYNNRGQSFQEGYKDNRVYSDRYKGEFTPVRKPVFKDVKPIWSKAVIIGKVNGDDGNMRYWSQVKVYIKPPSTEHPKHAVMVSMLSGGRQTFARLAGLEDLMNLVTTLTGWLPEMQAVISGLKPTEDQLVKAKEQMNAILKQREDLKALLEDNPELLDNEEMPIDEEVIN